MKKGYISITALLIMSILLIMVTHLNHISIIEYLLLGSTLNSIQSQYYSEDKIYLSLNDDYYENHIYPEIIKHFRKESYTRAFKLKKSDLMANDTMETIEVNFSNNKNRKEFKIISKSDYNGIRSRTIANGNLVNEIFENPNPYLFTSNINEEDNCDTYNIIEKVFRDIKINESNIPNPIYSNTIRDYHSTSLIMDDNRNYKLLSTRESMTLPFINSFSNKEIFLILKNNNHQSNLILGGNKEVCTKVEISGLIYIEGDILITKDFIFNGILIIRDGELKIKDDATARINGLIISNSLNNQDLEMENMEILFDMDSVYKYGVFLPGFIDLKIRTIKTD